MCAVLKAVLLVGTCLAGLGSSVPAQDGEARSNGPGTFSVITPPNPGLFRRAPGYQQLNRSMPRHVGDELDETEWPGMIRERSPAKATDFLSPYTSDNFYIGTVGFGKPKSKYPVQWIPVQWDTGSSDLWVMTKATKGAQPSLKFYDPTKSSSANGRTFGGYWFGVTYADQSGASATPPCTPPPYVTEDVSVAGVTVNGQSVGLAQTVTGSSLTNQNFYSGIVGLGFQLASQMKPNPQLTFFENTIPLLNQPLFTADLKHNRPGKLNFGYIDTTVPTSKISYTHIDTDHGTWLFSASGYAIGNGKFQTGQIQGLADTGTSQLLLPAGIVAAYYKKIPGTKNLGGAMGYVVPNCKADLPSFTFGVGNLHIVIPGRYINFMPASMFTPGTPGCVGGIQVATGTPGSIVNIFGDIALKSAFVVFDSGLPRGSKAQSPPSPRIGFATKRLD